MAFEDRRNNPGNLKFANQPGAIGKDEKGFAIFPDQETGMKAMRRQLELDLVQRGKTGREFIYKYAPPSDNNPTDAYVKNVFGELGIDPDKRVDPKRLDDIQRLMVRQEKGVAGMQHYYANRQDTEKGRILASTPTAPESPPTKISSAIDDVKSKAMRAALSSATKRLMANMKNAPSAADVNKFYSSIGIGGNVVSENAVRFKDLRKKIQEHVISENQIEDSKE